MHDIHEQRMSGLDMAVQLSALLSVAGGLAYSKECYCLGNIKFDIYYILI